MPVPNCPACGGPMSVAGSSDESSPLCEACRKDLEQVKIREGRGIFPPTMPVVVLEPSGPFALPDMPPPRDVLDDMEVLRRAVEAGRGGSAEPSEQIIIESSGPFHLPMPPIGLGLGGDGDGDGDDDDVVIEPSGPFHLPPPPVSAAYFHPVGWGDAPSDQSAEELDAGEDDERGPVVIIDVTGPFLHQGKDKVLSGIVTTLRREEHPSNEGPTIVVEPELTEQGEATLSMGRPDPVALEWIRTRWLPIGIAFLLGVGVGFVLAHMP